MLVSNEANEEVGDGLKELNCEETCLKPTVGSQIVRKGGQRRW